MISQEKNKTKLGNDLVINAIIRTFEKHLSIRKLKGHMHANSVFSFGYVTKKEVEKEIRLLNESKASQGKDIPVEVIEGKKIFFSEIKEVLYKKE